MFRFFQASFQNPENDTDDWFDSSFLGRLWLFAFAPFLRPVPRTLSFRNFRSRFRFVIDLGLKPRLPASPDRPGIRFRLSTSALSLERR